MWNYKKLTNWVELYCASLCCEKNAGKFVVLLFGCIHAYILHLFFLFFSYMGIREFIAPNVTVDNFVPVKLKATIHKVKGVLQLPFYSVILHLLKWQVNFDMYTWCTRMDYKVFIYFCLYLISLRFKPQATQVYCMVLQKYFFVCLSMPILFLVQWWRY